MTASALIYNRNSMFWAPPLHKDSLQGLEMGCLYCTAYLSVVYGMRQIIPVYSFIPRDVPKLMAVNRHVTFLMTTCLTLLIVPATKGMVNTKMENIICPL